MGDMPQGTVQSLKFHPAGEEGRPHARVVPLLIAQTTPEHPLSWPGFWIGGFPEGGGGAGFESHHPGGNMTRSLGAFQVIHWLFLLSL